MRTNDSSGTGIVLRTVIAASLACLPIALTSNCSPPPTTSACGQSFATSGKPNAIVAGNFGSILGVDLVVASDTGVSIMLAAGDGGLRSPAFAWQGGASLAVAAGPLSHNAILDDIA